MLRSELCRPAAHPQQESIPMGRAVTVRVPATSANLGAGFGALVAANRLLDDPFDPERTLLLATELEGHADNAAPALFGGFQVVVWDEGMLTHVRVPLPESLQAVVLIPD